MWECKNLEKRSNFLFQLLKYKILLLNTEWTYGPFILGKLKKKDSQRFLKKKKACNCEKDFNVCNLFCIKNLYQSQKQIKC